MRTLRLVKVFVQPVLMLDDGDSLTEIAHPTLVVPAADWPAYSGDTFPKEVAAWQERLDADAAENEGQRG